MSNFQAYIPDPPNCKNKWCSKNFPSENMYQVSCSDISELKKRQLETGGRTGRGVTPCGTGYLQHNGTIQPYNKDHTDVKKSMLLETLPGHIPPQGNIRSHIRIGNVYRN